MGTIALIIVCSILMVVGLAGVVLPLLPGIPLSWLGFFIYAIGTGFERISITIVVIFFILMLLTLVMDFVAPMLGARRYKASRLGVFSAFLGFTVGIFVFNIILCFSVRTHQISLSSSCSACQPAGVVSANASSRNEFVLPVIKGNIELPSIFAGTGSSNKSKRVGMMSICDT